MGYTIPEADVLDYPASALYRFHVYSFEWIDNSHFILPPARFVKDPAPYIAVVKERFLEAGWEGDGDIGILWLPPFVFPLAMRVSPRGIAVWHVKQEEDGVSFLLAPRELPFDGLGGTGWPTLPRPCSIGARHPHQAGDADKGTFLCTK